ncbi:MAG: GNAT family N-acetyltransferase [Saprospiraceae bacterium]|nr:GNAT family N-acetyltransferase [Saprospiraceae bacterium]
MTFRTLQGTSTARLTMAFNRAFSDYMVPLQMTETQLENKMAADSVRLDLSAGAFEGEELIGFILHGYDVVAGKPMVYNAGTGVAPDHRGQKITAHLYEFILPELKNAQVCQIQLEVIHGNVPAVKTYEAIGFEVARQLDCYKGFMTNPPVAEADIRMLRSYDWTLLKSFWDWQPSWQNSITAVENIQGSNISLGAWQGDQLLAYLIYNPVSNRIQQFAVTPTHRRTGIGSALFYCAAQQAGKELVLINVDHRSSETASFLQNIGLQPFLQQYEMIRLL